MKRAGWGTSYPGEGYFYILCDLCGKKIRQKDSYKIMDKWNRHNGLVVCKADFDVTNQQAIPIYTREYPLPQPEYTRSEPSDYFMDNAINDRVPDAPTELQIYTDPIGGGIMLRWKAPEDPGSSVVNGYEIVRSSPQVSVNVVIVANTGNGDTLYIDNTADLSSEYSYQVAAINEAGTSSLSNIAYFPYQINTDSEYNYLVTGSSDILVTGSSNYLVSGVVI
jgi:hypothetical protein